MCHGISELQADEHHDGLHPELGRIPRTKDVCRLLIPDTQKQTI